MSQILMPTRHESLSPEAFLKLTKEAPHKIKHSRFVPPTLGDHSFGHVEVEYRISQMRPVSIFNKKPYGTF